MLFHVCHKHHYKILIKKCQEQHHKKRIKSEHENIMIKLQIQGYFTPYLLTRNNARKKPLYQSSRDALFPNFHIKFIGCHFRDIQINQSQGNSDQPIFSPQGCMIHKFCAFRSLECDGHNKHSVAARPCSIGDKISRIICYDKSYF